MKYKITRVFVLEAVSKADAVRLLYKAREVVPNEEMKYFVWESVKEMPAAGGGWGKALTDQLVGSKK